MVTVFGLNGFPHFLPLPMPPALAGQFFSMIFASHLDVAIFASQASAGIPLLAGGFGPAAPALPALVSAGFPRRHMTPEPAGIAPVVRA